MTLIFNTQCPFLLIYMAGIPLFWAICILSSEYPELASFQTSLAKAILWPVALILYFLNLPYRLLKWLTGHN